MRALGLGIGTPFRLRAVGGGGAPADPTLALDLNFLTMTALDPRVTFTRAGTATVYDATGKLTTASNNMVPQSENFAHSNWTKDDTTFAAGVLTESTAALDHRLHSGAAVVFLAGSRINVSFEVKYVSCPYVAISHALSQNYYFNIQNGTLGTAGGPGTATITPIDSGFYRITVSDIVAAANMYCVLAMVNDTGSTIVYTGTSRQVEVRRAQFEVVAYETAPRTYLPTTTAAVYGPRFDYDPVALTPRGLLIEEQRINTSVQSEDLSHANWVKTNATITANAIAAPNGTTTADMVTSTSTVIFGVTTSNLWTAVPTTISAFIKKGTTSFVWARIQDSGFTSNAYFNLDTGAWATTTGYTSTTVEVLPGGWYRLSATRTPAAGTSNAIWGFSSADNATTTVVGATGYVWGAQAEVGAFPTSYIPTVAAAVTRAADVAVMTGTDFSSWYNASEGTFVAEFDAALGGSLGAGILSADDVSATRAIIFLKDNSNNARTDVSATTASFNSIVGTVTAGTNKLGLSFAVNDFAACINGGTVILDTLGGLPTPIQFRLGFAPGGGTYLDGHVRRVRFWNTAKSDLELQALTAPAVAPPALDLNFLSGTLDPRVTFTRAGPAKHYGADGLLRNAPHNLTIHSQNFADANWQLSDVTKIGPAGVADPAGGSNAYEVAFGAGGGIVTGASALYQNHAGLSAAQSYAITFYVRAKTGSSSIRIGFYDGIGNTGSPADLPITASAWTRISLTVPASSPTSTGNISLRNNAAGTTGNVYVYGAQFEQNISASPYIATTTAAAHGPRFDYDPVTLAPRGLLLEEQRTNLVFYSNDLANAYWLKTAGTVTSNTTTAPDGTLTADTLTAAPTAIRAHPSPIAVTNIATYTASLFVKKGTARFAILNLYQNGESRTWFDLDTGTVGTVAASTTAKMETLPGGWYRISITTVESSPGDLVYFVIEATTVDTGISTASGDTLIVWGAQLEAGAFATSYIPTVAAAVTRAADSASMTGTNFSSWWNASEGTLVLDAVVHEQKVMTYALMAWDGVSDNESIFFVDVGPLFWNWRAYDGGALQWNNNISAYLLNQRFKIGYAYKLNDIGACMDGGTVATTATATLPTVNRLEIGHYQTGGSLIPNWHIRRLTYYNTRKSNAELQALTT